MPIFEYKCGRCGAVAEFLESHSSRAEKSCPECGSKNLQKQPSVFSARTSEESLPQRCQGCPSSNCPYSVG